MFPDIDNYDFISFPYEDDNNSDVLVRIDYSKLIITVLDDETDGYANTKELYYFNGLDMITSLKDFLVSLGADHTQTSDSADISNPDDCAVFAAVKKNKFNITTKQVTVNGTTTTVQELILKDENFNWFLPARNESPLITDTEFPLSGSYWTSTAINDNADAFKLVSPGGSTATESRNVRLAYAPLEGSQ